MIENEAYFKFEPASFIVSIVKEHLRELGNSLKLPEPEVRDRFLDIYGYIEKNYPSIV